MDRNFRVAVVGAGAVGLSTALCIQDRIRNCDVTIIADQFSPSTTSDGSAGLWTPFLVPDDQREVVSQVFLFSMHSPDRQLFYVRVLNGWNVKVRGPLSSSLIKERIQQLSKLYDYNLGSYQFIPYTLIFFYYVWKLRCQNVKLKLYNT